MKKQKLADALTSGKVDRIAKAAGALHVGRRVVDFPMAPAPAH